RSREEADDPANAQAVGEADLIYFSGGKPAYLLDALSESAVWSAALAANERGAVLAGCSAGAMVLGGCQVNLRRLMLPGPPGWRGLAALIGAPRDPRSMGCAEFPLNPRDPSPVSMGNETRRPAPSTLVREGRKGR